MKILRTPVLRSHHWVNYHGVAVWVPKSAKALATDSTDRLHWYDETPYIQGPQWFTDNGLLGHVADVDLEGLHWQDSLVTLTADSITKLHAVVNGH
jgi:hypothetical protein